jgi:squalene-hopene/tetraprenyl-beta-curcumene cyclase
MSIVALQLVDSALYTERISQGRSWLFATQSPDGGWGDAIIDPSNINATSLALAALVFTQPGQISDAEHTALDRARQRLERFGGWQAVGDPDRCTLSGPCRTVAALAGIMDWRKIKRLRPEVIMLPRTVRRTISTTFPAYLSIATLHSVSAPHPLNQLPAYPRARDMSRDWLAQAQGPNGSFEESAFLTSVIIACWTAAGYGDLPWLQPAIQFVLASQRDDGGWPIDRDLETFDTDLTVLAWDETGLPLPNMDDVRTWLLARQFTTDCFPTGARPGGWAWAMPAGWPDADDTSYTLLTLRTLGVPASDPAIIFGADWLERMQNSDGSWSTFVRNSRMPFDHDCPYITGHVLCALQVAGRLEQRPHILERALRYLDRAQRYDGSFASIWFRETTAGTASVIEALHACGLLSLRMAKRARESLLRQQNDDGGWGGMRLQASTAEETAWAIMALLRWPEYEPARAAARRGVRWLLDHQRPDGTWAEWPIALYYSAMWYSDSYYAVALPMQALARAKAHHVDG